MLQSQILSKTASNEVMETVDADIGDTCKDLGEVKKVFQLALLCTKRQPSDRPTMHEVVRVLDCLVNPDPPPKSSTQQPLGQLPQAPPSVPSYMNEYVSLRAPGRSPAPPRPAPRTRSCSSSLARPSHRTRSRGSSRGLLGVQGRG